MTRLKPVAATIGVIVGTAAGARLLRGLPDRVFRRSVAILLVALGVYMILAAPSHVLR